jgi:hypothetical protein
MRKIKQSTAKNIMVFMTDSSNRAVGKSGLTLVIIASKDGGATAAITPTVTDRGVGLYNIALTASHTDTLGDLWLYITAIGADPNPVPLEVVAYDPGSATSLGLSNLNATVSSRAAPGDAMTLTGAYDAAKTAAAPGAAMALTGDYDAAKTAAQEGDVMNLDPAYDAAKAAAQATDLTDVETIVTEVRRILKNKLTENKTTSVLELWNDAGDTIIMTWPLTDKDGAPIVLTGTGPANRGVPT